MNTSEQIKNMVKMKYAEIAYAPIDQNKTSCCGSGGCSTEVYNIMTDDYSKLEGYQSIADLGLGCGLPTEFAKIKQGDTVVDLGSGAGNDCFVARAITGGTGKVIGIDFTPQMLEKARENATKLGFTNVEFKLGDIENMPIEANTANVVVSNCVLNLVPDKAKAFSEIHRILQQGGHFSISDVVLTGSLPENIKKASEMYAGCVSGAILKEEYLDLIAAAGFININIQKEKKIEIPVDILRNYLNPDELASFIQSNVGIYSITVFGEKN